MPLRFSPARGASVVISASSRGPTGAAGQNGAAATIAAGTTTTAAAGASASVSNSGSSSAAVFDFSIPRGADAGLKYTFATSTDTSTTPSSGGVKFNNATPASITEIALHAVDADGNTVRPYWLTTDDSTNTTKGTIVFKRYDGIAIVFNINGTFTDNTTWLKLSVTHSSGTTLFAASDKIYGNALPTGNKGTDGAGTGDFSTNTATSVDGEMLLFSGTAGKTGKRSTLNGGLLKSTSGVPSIAASGTDYAPATSGSAILKGNGSGGFSSASAGTDYYNPGGTDVAVADGGTGSSTAAGALTNLAARGQGKDTIFIPAGAMVSRTTNGAAAGSVEQSSNKNMIKSLDFDTTTQEFAQFSVWFPKSWNLSTVTFQPTFSQLTTAAGGVVFGLAGVAVSDGDALDVAYGTAQTSTKTAGTANLEYQGPESSAITIAGTPAAADRVMFQVNRTVSDGSDTLAQDARLHGIRLFFTTNAATDA